MLLIQILPLVCYYIFHNWKYTVPLFLAYTYNVLLLSSTDDSDKNVTIAVKIYTFLLGIGVDVRVYNTTYKRYVGNICTCISSTDFYFCIPSETSDMSLITHHSSDIRHQTSDMSLITHHSSDITHHSSHITHQTSPITQGVSDWSHTHTHIPLKYIFYAFAAQNKSGLNDFGNSTTKRMDMLIHVCDEL